MNKRISDEDLQALRNDIKREIGQFRKGEQHHGWLQMIDNCLGELQNYRKYRNVKAPEYILIDGPAYCKYRLPCGMCERTGEDCSRDTAKETADKQIIAPLGTVKSVRIIEADGRKRLIPLDKVIIERYEDGQI